MPNSRYHIHVIEVFGDQPQIDSQLALFLENKAFVTRDLLLVTDDTANYSRRCIDACDFVIMVVSDSYGVTNLSGVSQMHLSYLTVKTKRKPILIFIKSPSDVERSRQLLDFIDTVEQRGPQQLYYFQDLQSFTEVLTQSYRTMLDMVPNKGWVKNNVKSENGLSLAERFPKYKGNQSKNNTVSTPLKDMMYLKDLELITGDTQSSNIQASDTQASDSQSSSAASRKKSRRAIKKESTTKTASTKKAVVSPDSDNYMGQLESSYPETANKNRLASRSEVQGSYRLSHGPLKQVSLNHSVDLTYDAHAYQDGNIKDVTIKTTMTWLQLLHLLEDLGDTFSSDTMYRALNDEVARTAAQSVAKVLPKAHAVSKCMVRQADFVWVQDQLVFNGWLRLVPQKAVNRESWQLTDKALKVLLSER